MSKRWVNRTYTYSEPVDESEYKPEPHGVTGPDTVDDPSAVRTGHKADYDAGYVAGYKNGWVVGYDAARKLYEPNPKDQKVKSSICLTCGIGKYQSLLDKHCTREGGHDFGDPDVPSFVLQYGNE